MRIALLFLFTLKSAFALTRLEDKSFYSVVGHLNDVDVKNASLVLDAGTRSIVKIKITFLSEFSHKNGDVVKTVVQIKQPGNVLDGTNFSSPCLPIKVAKNVQNSWEFIGEVSSEIDCTKF